MSEEDGVRGEVRERERESEGTRHFGTATKIANYLPGSESNNLLG